MRRVAPTRLGIEMSQKMSEVEKVKPAAGSWTTTMDHSCQTTKPRNSAKMDQLRLRRAMARPAVSHCSLFSASQLAIQRPGRNSRAGVSVVRAVPGCTPASTVRSTVTGYLLQGMFVPPKVGTAHFVDGRALLTRCDFCLSGPAGRSEALRAALLPYRSVRCTTPVRMVDVSSIDWTGASKIEL